MEFKRKSWKSSMMIKFWKKVKPKIIIFWVDIDIKEIEDDEYDKGYIEGYAKYFCENEIGNTIFI